MFLETDELRVIHCPSSWEPVVQTRSRISVEDGYWVNFGWLKIKKYKTVFTNWKTEESR